MTPLHCQSETSGFSMDNFYLNDSVTSLSFIIMNDNTGESQIEIQIHKNVNKCTNIVIILQLSIVVIGFPLLVA